MSFGGSRFINGEFGRFMLEEEGGRTICISGQAVKGDNGMICAVRLGPRASFNRGASADRRRNILRIEWQGSSDADSLKK